jgi:ethanolamine utilization protein EutN/carbon dioxide concentrating mechanism protein CcmL
MLFGKVAGTVVSTRKAESLEGLKLLVVRNVDVTGEVGKGYVVAADSVGAGLGEVVLYATGSSARQTDITNGKPVDAVIMGIVDTWDVDDKAVYTKYASADTADV